MKKVKKLLSILLVAVMLVCIAPATELGIKASAAQTIQITATGQVVDTFNGVSAIYRKGLNDNEDTTYSCAAFVKKYYNSIYGVDVWNLMTGYTPAAGSGSFSQTNSPESGDIGYQLNSKGKGHWFIIKSVSGSTYTIIEQNWKWESGGAYYCTKERQVSTSTSGFKAFRWSGKTPPEPFDPQASGTYIGQVTDSTFRPCIVMTSMSGVANIQVAVWSENDQSDLKWYDCLNNGSNTMYEDIYFSDHAYGAKVYHCHFYAYGYYGEEKYIGGCTYSLPINPVIGDDKNTVVPGQSITFWYSGLRECSKVVFNFIKNGEVYYSVDSTSSTEFTTYFENTGSYQVYVSGLYKGIWFDSNRITVNVLSPEIHDDKNSAAVGENITFEYLGLTECSYVELKFYKLIDNSYINYLNIDTTSSRYYTTYFEKPGQYKVCVSGYLNGNWVTSSSIDVHITKKLSITFNLNDKNGGTLNKEVTYDLPYGDLPVPTRTGFIFGGWFTEAEGGTLVTSDTIVTAAADHTLYAHWSGISAKEGSTAVIDGSYIYGLKTKLTAANIKNTFLDYEGVEVTLTKAIEDARYYGTGSTVTVKYSDGTEEVYTIIIFGDIDGNAIIDSDDAFSVLEASYDNSLFNAAQKKAANVDGIRRISIDDYSIINDAALGISEIDQTAV